MRVPVSSVLLRVPSSWRSWFEGSLSTKWRRLWCSDTSRRQHDVVFAEVNHRVPSFSNDIRERSRLEVEVVDRADETTEHPPFGERGQGAEGWNLQRKNPLGCEKKGCLRQKGDRIERVFEDVPRDDQIELLPSHRLEGFMDHKAKLL